MNDQQKPGDNPWAFGNGEGRGHASGFGGAKSAGGLKQKQRALLISRPTYVLEGQPGTILMPTIEVKNATYYGWKQGVFLGVDESANFTKMFIELVHQPIDFEVKGQETFKLTVPIQIAANA